MELNKIYNESCLVTMSKMEDECIDMVFADPPFNVGKKYDGYKDDIKDYYQWCESWISECFRVLKPTGSFYLMTIPRHLPTILLIMSKYGIFINLITWKNHSGTHNKRNYWNTYQPICFYGKTDKYKFHTYVQTKEGKTYWSKKRNENKKGQMGDYWDDIVYIYAGSIQHKEAILQPGTKKKVHPTQMPLNLVGRAILFSTDVSDLVYDPFMGSGTTAISSLIHKRYFLGSEISKLYADLTCKRIKDYYNQLKIF